MEYFNTYQRLQMYAVMLNQIKPSMNYSFADYYQDTFSAHGSAINKFSLGSIFYARGQGADILRGSRTSPLMFSSFCFFGFCQAWFYRLSNLNVMWIFSALTPVVLYNTEIVAPVKRQLN